MHKTIFPALLASLMSLPGNAEVRDPTQPPRIVTPSQMTPLHQEDTPWAVTEIWISDSNRHAIVSGVTVKAGEALDDETRVLKILPRYVLIKQHGLNKKLYLVPSIKNR